jgi:hypothetical protein
MSLRTRTTAPTERGLLRLLLVVTAVAVVAAVSTSLATGALAGEGRFSDVGADHPFADDIAFMAESGIAGGFPDGTYRPGEPVSRQAMAAFLHRAQTYRIEASLGLASNTPTVTATATCDPGETAISGGGTYQGPGRAFISASGPTAGGAWRTQFTTDGGLSPTNHSMTAFALCAPGDIDTDAQP